MKLPAPQLVPPTMNLPADTPATDPLAARVIRDAVCPACGCVCDDIDLVVRAEHVVEAHRACPRGTAWLVERSTGATPECTIEGREVSQFDAIARAAEILTAARYPLVYGLTETTCEAQRLAVSIADWIGGTLDTPTSACHGPPGTKSPTGSRLYLLVWRGWLTAGSAPQKMTRSARWVISPSEQVISPMP